MKYSYRNSDGKMVHGSAAMVHLIYTVCGGVGNFLRLFGRSTIRIVPRVSSKFADLFKNRKAS